MVVPSAAAAAAPAVLLPAVPVALAAAVRPPVLPVPVPISAPVPVPFPAVPVPVSLSVSVSVPAVSVSVSVPVPVPLPVPALAAALAVVSSSFPPRRHLAVPGLHAFLQLGLAPLGPAFADLPEALADEHEAHVQLAPEVVRQPRVAVVDAQERPAHVAHPQLLVHVLAAQGAHDGGVRVLPGGVTAAARAAWPSAIIVACRLTFSCCSSPTRAISSCARSTSPASPAASAAASAAEISSESRTTSAPASASTLAPPSLSSSSLR
eukprot:CAMPEP_0206380324 /NCGR_PEP_ID=MMETSP0294-20121207/11955_1 /ASSEMBLY_ACC=CAM_ASM_000327 /TAXON_ID=39354 /ORGANISM="Heterosigma akashiwo, Strain CCMP2393" /LENGTH=264 /DNA_ID=CAMNT_0053829509 /DNA_START=256 /DNA_END=1051 /DNA_ORIENTATION=-